MFLLLKTKSRAHRQLLFSGVGRRTAGSSPKMNWSISCERTVFLFRKSVFRHACDITRAKTVDFSLQKALYAKDSSNKRHLNYLYRSLLKPSLRKFLDKMSTKHEPVVIFVHAITVHHLTKASSTAPSHSCMPSISPPAKPSLEFDKLGTHLRPWVFATCHRRQNVNGEINVCRGRQQFWGSIYGSKGPIKPSWNCVVFKDMSIIETIEPLNKMSFVPLCKIATGNCNSIPFYSFQRNWGVPWSSWASFRQQGDPL